MSFTNTSVHITFSFYCLRESKVFLLFQDETLLLQILKLHATLLVKESRDTHLKFNKILHPRTAKITNSSYGKQEDHSSWMTFGNKAL